MGQKTDVIENYNDNSVKLFGEMHDGLLHGYLSHYDEDGSLIMRAKFFQGELHGRLCLYNINQLVQVIRYVREKKHGVAYYFSSARHLLVKENYYQDKLHGKIFHYYDNGNIAREIHYRFGLRCGEEKLFDAEGKLVAQNYYEDDRMITKSPAEERLE